MLFKKEDINNNKTEQRRYFAAYAVLARCVVWQADCLTLKMMSYDPSELPELLAYRRHSKIVFSASKLREYLISKISYGPKIRLLKNIKRCTFIGRTKTVVT
jgi:hypothetical protein